MYIYVIIGIVVIMLVIILGMYNNLVRLRNKVKQSEAAIDVYLNQRFDLIPNLVECVKAYSKHETEVLENIVKLRNEYNENNKGQDVDLQQASTLNNSMNKLIAIAESYPDLKASEQYLNLQKNLIKMESQLQAARRIYNNDVTTYNTKIDSVPNNIIAALYGFKKAELFQIEEYKRENININLESDK